MAEFSCCGVYLKTMILKLFWVQKGGGPQVGSIMINPGEGRQTRSTPHVWGSCHFVRPVPYHVHFLRYHTCASSVSTVPVRSWWSCRCCIYGFRRCPEPSEVSAASEAWAARKAWGGPVQQETEDGQWASIRPARVDSTKWHNTHTGARKWCHMLYSGWFARESSDWVMMQTVLFGFDSFLHFFSKFDGRIFLLWGLLKNDDFEAFLGPERGGPTSGLNHDKSRRGQANQVYSPCLRIMPFCKTSSLPCSFCILIIRLYKYVTHFRTMVL